MKKIYYFSLVSFFLSACTYEKGQAPQPTLDCVQDPVKHLRTVSLGDNFFSPMDLELIEGDTVKWVNNGTMPHTVTCDGSSGTSRPQGASAFDSGVATPINPGETFQSVISTPGNYTYVCLYHSGMSGTLIVKKRCP